MTVALELAWEFDAKRREFGRASPFAKCANSDDAPITRRLSDQSDVKRRDFVIRHFIASEQREIQSKARKFVLNKGYEVVEKCREHVSGMADESDRPGLQRAEELARAGTVKKS